MRDRVNMFGGDDNCESIASVARLLSGAAPPLDFCFSDEISFSSAWLVISSALIDGLLSCLHEFVNMHGCDIVDAEKWSPR